MNILKEIGIQQWRRRSARPVVEMVLVEGEQAPDLEGEQQALTNDSFEQAGHNSVNTDLRAALKPGASIESDDFNVPPVVQEEVPPQFESTTSDMPADGFSGSLRQALNQSIASKEANKSSSESVDQSNVKTVEENTPDDQTAGSIKQLTPINLSALIPEPEPASSDVMHELAEFNASNGDDYSMVNIELEGDHSVLNSAETTNDIGAASDSDNLLDSSVIVNRDLSNVGWPDLQKLIETNEHCPSCGWGNAFLGAGQQDADWMFVIDAPNSRDIQAKALFSGRAGQLFDAMLSALGVDRERVYSSSVFKCAPTDDLSVTPQCDELVHRQIQLVSPKVVVTFGEFAAQSVIKSNSPLPSLRSVQGQHCFRSTTPVIPTYSPAEMLDDASLKAHVWADLKHALSLI